MCPEGNAASSSSPPQPAATYSPSGKRSRDPEDEVYVDNLHSHKRYLSEIMASSLNGLKVGDPLSINLVDSSARLVSRVAFLSPARTLVIFMFLTTSRATLIANLQE